LGRTILHNACENNYESIVRELLLDARINVSIRDNFGETAMDIAIRKNITELPKCSRE